MNSRGFQLISALVLCAILLVLIYASIEIFSKQSGHVQLLTVSTTEDGRAGGIADVYLEIRPGQGNVYMDTFPFTKLDTQISTRYAKEVACKTAQVNCDSYDFFYTLRASSNIVGGPSAGAAIAALTTAVLLHKPVREDIAITGTINSGGIVGSVGGVREKVAAAQRAGIKTVLIPSWQWDNKSYLVNNKSNYPVKVDVTTLLLTSPPKNITVVEIVSLEEAVSVLTGEDFRLETGDLYPPKNYVVLMSLIANQLCNRSQEIQSQLSAPNDDDLLNISNAFIASSKDALLQKDYYSAASYCYSANLRLRQLQLKNFSQEKLQDLAQEINVSIAAKRFKTSNEPLETITDIQTAAIVQERLIDAQEYLDETISSQSVASALERYYSAVVWSNFFQLPGKKLHFDQSHLQNICEQKLSEVEERQSFLSVLLNSYVDNSDGLRRAYDSYYAKNYALCLFQASKEKGRIDVLVSSTAVSPEDFENLVAERINITQSLIYREIKADRFPLMGYSYHEYAMNLQGEDIVNAALFSSYALELSDMSLYFPEKNSFLGELKVLFENAFFIGFIVGVVTLLLVWTLLYKS